MRCNEVKESLIPYLDDEVEAVERDRIDSHLACCPDCRREQAELDSTGDLLRLLDRTPISGVDLAGRVIAEATRAPMASREDESGVDRPGIDNWCGHIRRTLVAHTDGELTGADARPVLDHLAECADCQVEEADHRRVAAAFAAWTVPDFDIDLTSRILPVPRKGRLLRLGSAVAAAVVLLAVGLFGMFGDPGNGEPVVPETSAHHRDSAPPAGNWDDAFLAGDNIEWLGSVAEEELAMLSMGG